MKRISLTGFSLLVILAGCSKQFGDQPGQTGNDDAWKYDESLPVPVQFAPQGISITTRGIIENDSDLEGKPIGIFGLSVWHQDTGIVPGWNPDDPSTVLFADEPEFLAKVKNIEMSGKINKPGVLAQLTDRQKERIKDIIKLTYNEALNNGGTATIRTVSSDNKD